MKVHLLNLNDYGSEKRFYVYKIISRQNELGAEHRDKKYAEDVWNFKM